MKKNLMLLGFIFLSTMAFSQAGHIMQGVGAVNMSMGGASTAQPLDISGALQWNPAAISTFDEKIIKLDLGLFFSSPELESTLPTSPTTQMSGTTEDDRGISPMPALAMVWGDTESKHTFGVSLFGISGFGVTFPQNLNNPINMPQSAGGFGRIESDYSLLQIGITWAYQITEKLSLGIQPTLNYATLELMPNPTAPPNQAGYPSTNRANSIGYGAQIGLFYDTKEGLKAGISYKTEQTFDDFEFDNTYLDASTSSSKFNMGYPAILSLGIGYSITNLDFAIDYRMVDYENTDGFSETGWTQYGSVKGFGWENISIISAGVQYKGVEKMPIRVGYTYSSNPINSDVAFFNIPATAIIENAMQCGFSYLLNDKLSFDATYHHGSSNGSTSGPILNPMMSTPNNPDGTIPGSEVSYKMTTDLIMIGISYKL